MAAIHDLLAQVADESLRERLSQEIDKLTKSKKFGLVFEEHIPECTPLYDVPVGRGFKVAKKLGAVSDIYIVAAVKDGTARCIRRETKEAEDIPVDELVAVAEFGEPIYPYLKPIDTVCNAPDSDLWHTLIEADNYHALQLLEYLYAGKVDCIYIDPPYNTGAKDWKYNNDYVDGSDAYRHSKWLSMMQKRLKLAKKLLNPSDSVLIVTIDEKEYLHLGCLLEELFPNARIQMISSVTSHHGAVRMNEFTRTNEFIYFVMSGNYKIEPLQDTGYVKEGDTVHWQSFRRSNPTNIRPSRPFQFYPIYIHKETHKIIEVGEPLPPNVDRFSVKSLDNCETVFPVKDDGTEMMWSLLPQVLRRNIEKGFVRVGKYTPSKPQQFVIQYLMSGTIKAIESGSIKITGKAKDGSIIAENVFTKKMLPKTQWDFSTHDARNYGTKILSSIMGENRFAFPKSLYAVQDCLKIFTANNPNALIIDFFAGSGTTLHAVNLLNAEDGGHRRCIMVTNNEVSADEAKTLRDNGKQPGDEAWERLGIARYVTWPRTICSIMGKDINGEPLKGNYLGSGAPMADGFQANTAFFKLGFLDKTMVTLGRQFAELLPLLWLKAGAHAPCPTLETDTLPDMLILPENRFAVLLEEAAFAQFEERISAETDIETVFLVTDCEISYRTMIAQLDVPTMYQLYRDYLDNFRINNGRN